MIVASFDNSSSVQILVNGNSDNIPEHLLRYSKALTKFHDIVVSSDVNAYSNFDCADDDTVRQWLYDLQPCMNVLYDEWVKECNAFTQDVQDYVDSFIDVYCNVAAYYKTLLKYDLTADNLAQLAVAAIDFAIYRLVR